jgi:radical SAM-linked protein
VCPDLVSSPADPVRYRLRLSKQDDLRWISHRDLVRVVERMVRRAGLVMRTSEGFHPKPKIAFPSALALGVAARAEVLELELAVPVESQEMTARLNAQAPPGLHVFQVQALPPGQRKARVRAMTYEFPVPRARRPAVEQAMAELLAAPQLLVQREGWSQPMDLRAHLESLAWRGDLLHFRILASAGATLRPRDVLQALQVLDLEQQGGVLTRSDVELVA